MSAVPDIAAPLLAWHAVHGRHDLPWQRERTPYRVWISEVMLQQTQVATVIPYYERFLARFPDVASLAAAPQDEVLHLWSGLGYYSRARNLKLAAERICAGFGGELPNDVAALQELPGLGRSTAAAILALSQGTRHAILDGNVKRVLARCFAVEGSPAERSVEQQLWALAVRCTPQANIADYTQAIMDLGATLCSRRNPDCARCPLGAGCAAFMSGRQHELPAPRVRAARRVRAVVMLAAQRADGSVLLTRRPERGIWGGLWSLPEFEGLDAARAWATARLDAAVVAPEPLPALRHAFTHFDLEMIPLGARCAGHAGVMDEAGSLWYNRGAPAAVGLPAPISKLLANLLEAA